MEQDQLREKKFEFYSQSRRVSTKEVRNTFIRQLKIFRLRSLISEIKWCLSNRISKKTNFSC